MKKQPEVTAATRQALIDAFWVLYEKKRIDQIRVKEITDIAGNTRGTFYEYFLDIYDLLEKEETALIDRVLENAPAINTAGMDKMLSHIAAIYEENGRHLCLLIGEGGDQNFIHKFKDALYPAFRAVKSLPGSGAISIVYEFGINGLIMAFCAWYMSKERMPLEEFLTIAKSLVEDGIPRTLESIICE